MKSNTSFAEILSEKVQGDSINSTSTQTEISTNDPIGLAYMIGHFEKYQFKKSKSECFQQRKYSATYNKYQITKPKNHIFNQNQENSYLFFNSWDPQFDRNFSKNGLKKTFRQLALRLHPDHGGTAQIFIELKNHYEVLLGIFNRK